MNWSAGVGGSGLALAIALGSRCPSRIETQTKWQYEPTGYYDQAPAMKWDLAVSWGRGVWVSVSDSIRVGLVRLFAGSHTVVSRLGEINYCFGDSSL